MNDSILVDITDIAHGGEGIGRIDGQVVFVTGAIPGERVEVAVTERRKRLLRGRAIRILEASPDRADPPCPIVDRCGGCQWQHIAYPRQLELKRQILTQQLHRIGGFSEPPVEPTVASPQPFGYRATVRMAWTPDGRLGYRMAHSHDLVPAAWCPVAAPAINAILADPPDPGRAGADVRVWADPASGEARLAPAGAPDAAITVTVLDREFRVSAGSFMQANLPQLEAIIRTVIEFLEPAGEEVVVDAYCGVGVIGIHLAPLVGRVVGIEASDAAVQDAAVNGEQVDNFDIWQGAVADVLPELQFEAIDAVILDPPRSGCEPETIRAILEAAPGAIVYVSCDPPTLARDLKLLAEAGYELRTVRPIDLFPQTYHVESVALLRATGPIKRPGEDLVQVRPAQEEAQPPDGEDLDGEDFDGEVFDGQAFDGEDDGGPPPTSTWRDRSSGRAPRAGQPSDRHERPTRPPDRRPGPARSPGGPAARPTDRSFPGGPGRPARDPRPGTGPRRDAGPGRTAGLGRPTGQGRPAGPGRAANPGRESGQWQGDAGPRRGAGPERGAGPRPGTSARGGPGALPGAGPRGGAGPRSERGPRGGSGSRSEPGSRGSLGAGRGPGPRDRSGPPGSRPPDARGRSAPDPRARDRGPGAPGRSPGRGASGRPGDGQNQPDRDRQDRRR